VRGEAPFGGDARRELGLLAAGDGEVGGFFSFVFFLLSLFLFGRGHGSLVRSATQDDV